MSKAIYVDVTNCIGCHTCEMACVRAHTRGIDFSTFSPRLHVDRGDDGLSFSHCHQCLSAPCLTSCPTGAISFADDIVVVAEERCDGCEKCVKACPFGAMTMARRHHAADDETDPAEPLVALKCDLCRDIANGPSCVPVCPYHAVHLLDFAPSAAAPHEL